ncbi:MAG TPA: TIGR00730 family Rossman fold protein, partial [Chromatiaceae bacterium]|nr:TIGR00730 family Rossman fold protein [Chromatiaceae bacterium]
AECLTLVQTGKGRRIPIILVEKAFWRGMMDWFRNTLIEAGTISPEDMDLMCLCDEPEQIVRAIFDHYGGRGFALSPEEQEILLEL